MYASSSFTDLRVSAQQNKKEFLGLNPLFYKQIYRHKYQSSRTAHICWVVCQNIENLPKFHKSDRIRPQSLYSYHHIIRTHTEVSHRHNWADTASKIQSDRTIYNLFNRHISSELDRKQNEAK